MAEPVVTKSGLILPARTFPGLFDYLGTPQAFMSPIVQPVMLVADVSGQASQAGGGSNITEQLSAGPTTKVVSYTDVARWLVATPFNRANNTGINTYMLHFPEGFRFKLHDLRIQFDTDSAPVSGAAAQGSYLYKGSMPVSGTLATMFDGSQVWTTSPMANIAASTSFYCLHRIREKGAATGETTNFPQSASTVRTLRDDKPLPDLWLSGPAGLVLFFRTAVAAGGNLDNIAWDATLEIERTS